MGLVGGCLTATAVDVPSASAAGASPTTACSAPVHYAVSSNTIYLVAAPPTGGAWTLSEIRAVCPQVPLVEVDPIHRIWELSADLIVQNGQQLELHGAAAAEPGDVNTLRIQSGSDQLPSDVHIISVDYGVLNADSVTVTSWNDATSSPQTVWQLPDAAPLTARARAYVRAESYLDPATHADDESSMVINKSTFQDLGYFGAESYGVSYKAEGCSHTAQAVCQQVQVTGAETGSTFTHDYMGTYTWGANNMTFRDNSYYDNVMYGLDTHDVSRNLLITGNHSSYNGDHGIICSQACSYLTITDNTVDHNGLVPWSGPDPDVDVGGQVHGIMLHRGVTHSVVEGNDVFDQPNGAGIAVFDTSHETVNGNTLTDNLYGIRVSVGASDNTFDGNTITDDADYPVGSKPSYPIYGYVGTDVPIYNPTGKPTSNIFRYDHLNLHGLGSNPVKLTDAPGTIVSYSTFTGTDAPILEMSSPGSFLGHDTLPPNQSIEVKGAPGDPGGVTVIGAATPVAISLDAFSRAAFTSPAGYLYHVSNGKELTSVGAPGSTTLLTPATIGTTGAVVVSRDNMTLTASPSAMASSSTSLGRITAVVTTPTAASKLGFTILGLPDDALYTVTRDGRAFKTVLTGNLGRLLFTDVPPRAGTWTYVVTKG